MSNFAFHSFPRRKMHGSREAQIESGLKIAASILSHGLLLTPENYTIPLFDARGLKYDELKVLQNRICFTHIPPAELPFHSDTFGPFSLVYEIDDLRRIGGLPVHYVPACEEGSTGDLYGSGSEILGGVADAARLLNILVAIQLHMKGAKSFGMTPGKRPNDKCAPVEIKFNEDQSSFVNEFLQMLEGWVGAEIGVIHAKLMAATSCYYPTEAAKRPDKLFYYQQHEWRVSSYMLECQGSPLIPYCSPEQRRELQRIDSDFFSAMIDVPSAGTVVGQWSSEARVNKCRFLSNVGDIDVVTKATCLVVPDDLNCVNQLSAANRDRGVRIVTQSEFRGLSLDVI